MPRTKLALILYINTCISQFASSSFFYYFVVALEEICRTCGGGLFILSQIFLFQY